MSHMKAPIIFGIQSTELNARERDFLKGINPLGIILFKRNIESYEQVRGLNQSIKDLLGKETHIFIDQEGGRVQRFDSFLRDKIPPSDIFGRLAETDLNHAKKAVYANAWLIAEELKQLGFTANCAPCLDIFDVRGDGIIGDRAFSHDPITVAELGFEVFKAFYDQGIVSVIKHLPGHGKAPVDSHKKLPRVSAPDNTLKNEDFLAFKHFIALLKKHYPKYSPFGMTAHVLYKDIDEHNVATHSPILINNIIRNFMDFEGALMTDCLTMEALEGSMMERAQKAFAAGCDIILHCSGDLDEMEQIASILPPLSKKRAKRFSQNSLPFVPRSSPEMIQEKIEEANPDSRHIDR